MLVAVILRSCILCVTFGIPRAEQISEYFDIKFYNQTILTLNTNKSSIISTLLGCASFCQKESGCVSASYHDDGECRLCTVYVGDNCDICENYPGAQVLTKVGGKCLNGGVENSNGTCQCYYGYIGQFCETIMKDCKEGTSYYIDQEGIFYIKPTAASIPFLVYCSFKLSFVRTRLYLQRHLSSGSTFNRSWIEYRDGFGDMHTSAKNFWLGNKYWNYITSSNTYTMVIEMADELWVDVRQQEYDNVLVQDETFLFKLNVNGVSTTASGYPALGDSLYSLHGKSFSTFDSDNDNNALHCASRFGNGFWYGDINGVCAWCNPNGILINSAFNQRDGVDYEVFWDHAGIWSPWHVQMWLERR